MSTIIKFLSLFLLYHVGVSANPTCPTAKNGMINVHLVCHTHNDVGWLKTVDQYYYGSRKNVTWVGVQYILDSVMESLKKDKSRKFIYVESAFFFRWWDQQTNEMKQNVKGFVNNGQFEFIGGGWSMNDEADASYLAIIDQMTLGISNLRTTFGKAGVPRVAWQIDPFGHSKEQASLFAQMGFDGLFLGRIDHQDKSNRLSNKSMEFIWKASDNIGTAANIFTGILPNTYSPPRSFCFDLLCADDPIMDDINLEDNNLHKMVNNFIKTVQEQEKGYATTNLIMTMGEDFNYVNAESWYKNLDKLIKYVNREQQRRNSKINLMYSTPSCYLDALHSAKKQWPIKDDDFLPYSSDPHAYWTGYFTSRPALKGYINYANNLLQAAKQIAAQSNHWVTSSIENLARAVGVAQHHDAVTGTARQHVTDDYNKRLAAGISSVHKFLSDNIKTLFPRSDMVKTYEFCPKLNVSECSITEKEFSFIVTIYNPLGFAQSEYVRLPISNTMTAYKVTDRAGNSIRSQNIRLPYAKLKIPGRNSSAKGELIFYAENIPPMGTLQFHVYRATIHVRTYKEKRHASYWINPTTPVRDIMIHNKRIGLKFDYDTKKLKAITLTDRKMSEIKVDQTWMWYAGMTGNNEKTTARASGAYIFRPNGTANKFSDYPKITYYVRGALVSEVHQKVSPWLSQIFRIYDQKDYIEMEWLVGPIPIKDNIGKEIISRIKFENMKTNKTFYTISNGREMLKRVKNYRPSWQFKPSESISQNYYPVGSALILSSEDGKQKTALLNDRSQGGTSQENGEMELMVHRRLLNDDSFGVNEPLNETAFGEGLVVIGKHYLIHNSFDKEDCDFSCQHRTLAKNIMLKPIVAFSPSPIHIFKWKMTRTTEKKFSIRKLPTNINLLTMEAWEKNTILIRLEHFYEYGESKGFEQYVDVKNLFVGWDVLNIEEVTLATGHIKKEHVRYNWNNFMNGKRIFYNSISREREGVFLFTPMQIRTFILTIDWSNF